VDNNGLLDKNRISFSSTPWAPATATPSAKRKKDFYGIDEDVEARTVHRHLLEPQRPVGSPKFLIGVVMAPSAPPLSATTCSNATPSI
jgi:hypothetical protein